MYRVTTWLVALGMAAAVFVRPTDAAAPVAATSPAPPIMIWAYEPYELLTGDPAPIHALNANLVLAPAVLTDTLAAARVLDAAAAKGVRIVLNLHDAVDGWGTTGTADRLRALIASVRSHPALYGYLLYDEPEDVPARLGPYRAVAAAVKAADPARPTIGVYSRYVFTPEGGRFAGTADIEAFDYYPGAGCGPDCPTMAGFRDLLRRWASLQASLGPRAARSWWIWPPGFHVADCGTAGGTPCSSTPPQADLLIEMIDLARATDPRFDGVAYWSYQGRQNALGIRDLPALQRAVAQANRHAADAFARAPAPAVQARFAADSLRIAEDCGTFIGVPLTSSAASTLTVDLVEGDAAGIGWRSAITISLASDGLAVLPVFNDQAAAPADRVFTWRVTSVDGARVAGGPAFRLAVADDESGRPPLCLLAGDGGLAPRSIHVLRVYNGSSDPAAYRVAWSGGCPRRWRVTSIGGEIRVIALDPLLPRAPVCRVRVLDRASGASGETLLRMR